MIDGPIPIPPPSQIGPVGLEKEEKIWKDELMNTYPMEWKEVVRDRKC